MFKKDGSRTNESTSSWNKLWGTVASYGGVVFPMIAYWRREARYESSSNFRMFSAREVSFHGKCPGSRFLGLFINQTGDSSAKVAMETAMQECLNACPDNLRSRLYLTPFVNLHITILELGSLDFPSLPTPEIELEELKRARHICSRAVPIVLKLSKFVWTQSGCLVALWHPKSFPMASTQQAGSCDSLRMNLRSSLNDLYNQKISQVEKKISQATKNKQQNINDGKDDSPSMTSSPSTETLMSLTHQLSQVSAARASLTFVNDTLTFKTTLARIVGPSNANEASRLHLLSEPELRIMQTIADNATRTFTGLELQIDRVSYVREDFAFTGSGMRVQIPLGGQFAWGGALSTAAEDSCLLVFGTQEDEVCVCKGIESSVTSHAVSQLSQQQQQHQMNNNLSTASGFPAGHQQRNGTLASSAYQQHEEYSNAFLDVPYGVKDVSSSDTNSGLLLPWLCSKPHLNFNSNSNHSGNNNNSNLNGGFHSSNNKNRREASFASFPQFFFYLRFFQSLIAPQTLSEKLRAVGVISSFIGGNFVLWAVQKLFFSLIRRPSQNLLVKYIIKIFDILYSVQLAFLKNVWNISVWITKSIRNVLTDTTNSIVTDSNATGLERISHIVVD